MELLLVKIIRERINLSSYQYTQVSLFPRGVLAHPGTVSSPIRSTIGCADATARRITSHMVLYRLVPILLKRDLGRLAVTV